MRVPEIVLGAAIATVFWAIVALFNQSLVGLAGLKDWAGPAATVLAASAAAWVAYSLGKAQIAVATEQAATAQRTWETAHERIVLELFERRLEIFEGVRAAIGAVVSSGAADHGLLTEYYKAIDRVPYFFGPEIQAYLENIRKHIIQLNLAKQMMKDREAADFPRWVEKSGAEFLAVTKFHEEAPRLFAPYISAHQKLARPPQRPLAQLLFHGAHAEAWRGRPAR